MNACEEVNDQLCEMLAFLLPWEGIFLDTNLSLKGLSSSVNQTIFYFSVNTDEDLEDSRDQQKCLLIKM